MNRIAASALLNLIEQTGLDVATLAEGLDEADLRRSRLTRAELLRQLRLLANSAIAVPPSARDDLPELDWEGWRRPRCRGCACAARTSHSGSR